MPVTEFDDLLRDQFEQGSFEYKPAGWERLSKELPIKKKPLFKRIFWLPLAAAAAAILGIITIPLVQHQDAAPVAVRQSKVHIAVKSASSSGGGTTTSEVMQVNPAQMMPVAAVSSVAKASSSAVIIGLHKKAVGALRQPAISDANPVIAQGSQSSNVAAAIEPDAEMGSNAQPITEVPQENVAADPVVVAAKPDFKRNTVPLAGGLTSFDGPHYEGELSRPFKASSLSIAGGYKYGTSNMGYMVGVNGRRSIGGKVFLEGDLAFANSRNAQVTNQSTTENFQQVKAIAGTNAIGARAVSRGEVVSNMYYLQLTPTVGYQVYRTMSLGAGADVQRMFQNSGSTSYVINGNDVKALPQMDYGIVGKAEYSLTKTFKAGVQYRQGLNTMMSPDKNYLNRSYLQVQLKLGILGK